MFILVFNEEVKDNEEYCICTLKKLLVSSRALELLHLDFSFVESF